MCVCVSIYFVFLCALITLSLFSWFFICEIHIFVIFIIYTRQVHDVLNWENNSYSQCQFCWSICVCVCDSYSTVNAIAYASGLKEYRACWCARVVGNSLCFHLIFSTQNYLHIFGVRSSQPHNYMKPLQHIARDGYDFVNQHDFKYVLQAINSSMFKWWFQMIAQFMPKFSPSNQIPTNTDTEPAKLLKKRKDSIGNVMWDWKMENKHQLKATMI